MEPLGGVLERKAPVEASDHWEHQYLALMARIWDEGAHQQDRTGVGTRSLFGASMRFSLAGGAVPLLTTKRVYWKTAAREMLWFLSGETSIRPLVAQGVHIWTDWPLDRYCRETGEAIDRDAFEARILAEPDFAARWGDLGPVYGSQWTDWPVYEPAGDSLFRRRPRGIDQVAQVAQALVANPASRRHIIEGWNVAELDRMALPPCHKTYQFHVADGRLTGLLFQRSADLALGVPFNLFGLALLTRLFAHVTGLEAHEIVWQAGDVHLYENHAALVAEQLARTPAGSARLAIRPRGQTMRDFVIEDFSIEGYAPQPHIAAPVAV